MLEHWLHPVCTHKIVGFDALEEEQIGRKIIIYHPNPSSEASAENAASLEGRFVNLKNIHIAIIGIGSEDADAVRTAFYALSHPFSGLNIVDLGNIRKQETSFIIPLITELLQGGIVPILIGHSEIFTLAQYQSYQSKKGSVSMVIVDEKVRFTPKVKTGSYFLHQILEDSHLFNCSVIGYQTHFTPPQYPTTLSVEILN